MLLGTPIIQMLWGIALLCPLSLAQDISSYTPCPILGPRYPYPVQLSQWPTVQDALANLTDRLDKLIDSGGQSSYTDTTPNTTTFSIALFEVNDEFNVSAPFFYEYHHVAPSLKNTTEVNSNSVYNIAGLSQVLTVYTFLAAAGEEKWYEPVTKYVPELVDMSRGSAITAVDWASILLIDLATHLAGIAREGKSNLQGVLSRRSNQETATGNNIPSPLPGRLATIIPPFPRVMSASQDDRQSFLDSLRLRRPIYQAATTPIYSDAAFQLLAIALERITGSSFTSVVQASIFEQLNTSATTVGPPDSDTDAIIVNKGTSTWGNQTSDAALNAANGMFSTVSDMSIIGQSILRSKILSSTTTNRWLKPHSYTSNPLNSVGVPFDIYAPSLTEAGGAPIIPLYTKLGSHGLYSPYFGLDPDHGLGFVILTADTDEAADLNAYADLISDLIAAMERTAAEQATINYSGNYTSKDGAAWLVLDVDGLSGLSVLSWTANNGSMDVKGAYAELNGIPPATLDLRLYPTNLQEDSGSGKKLAFRAVAQDTAAPVDAGTPTCVTWETSIDVLVYNGIALDEFVFQLDAEGGATVVDIPALGMPLSKNS